MKPVGHGFYLPALEKTKALLSENNHGSCSLSVLFFSDGRPSDCVHGGKEFTRENIESANKDIVHCIGEIAAQFGRRLHMAFVGMAHEKERFGTLRKMKKEATSYGALATFNRPRLNTDSLSQIISSSVASSLSTKMELTSLETGQARAVRMDVKRERYDVTDGQRPTEEWRVFSNAGLEMFVANVWVWNKHTQDLAALIDPRCRECFKMVADLNYNLPKRRFEPNKPPKRPGARCALCDACFFLQTVSERVSIGRAPQRGLCRPFTPAQNWQFGKR